MLTPDYLEHVADDVIEMYAEFEQSIIKDIAKRLTKTNLLVPSINHQIKVLQESGMLYKDIIKEVSRITGKSEAKIKKIFENSAMESISLDDSIYQKVGFNPIPLKQSESMLQMLVGGLEKTNKQINNLTMTLAGNSQAKFTNTVNLAYLQVTSGAFDKNTAILNAVKVLSEDGLDIVYPSGKISKVDVAVRRAIVTGVNQTCGKLQEMRADEFECDLMELTAHPGARVTEKNDYTNHAWWQGRIVSRSGKKGYLSLEDIGYGEITGFLGINCRHGWSPFFEGITKRRYTDEELENINNQSVNYKDKEIGLYEATKMQRFKERNIRKLKRELGAYEEILKTSDDEDLKQKTTLKYNTTKNKLNNAQDELMRFTKETGLKRQYERERVINNKNNSINKTKQNKDDIITTDNLFQKLDIDLEKYSNDNDIQEQTSKLLGYDSKPNVLSKEQFENLDTVEMIRYFHDYKNISAKEAYNNTINGKIQYSNINNSEYGRGIYFGDKADTKKLLDSFGDSNSVIMNAKISKEAKILEFKNKFEFLIDCANRIEKLPNDLKNIFKYEKSLLYMLDGYDGIKINDKKYYCIYNRGVINIHE